MEKYEIGGEIPENINKNLQKYPNLVKKLLFNRGIKNQKEAEKFLNPDYEKDVHDPFLLKNMDKAVSRILRAIKAKEKIIIYSDYDADGIPGAVILHDFFTKIEYQNFENYIPHRDEEGFGLNLKAIKKFKKDKIKLIITIDCGIADSKEVAEAERLGMDVIITDHHLPNGALPKAFAIINPNQKGDEYPCKLICGSAVIFKVVVALIKKGDFEIKEGWEKWLLDMVGIATIADMVSLTEENRALATYGLQVLKKSPRPGLKRLLRRASIKQEAITEDDIGFVLAPRINSASRMGVPIIAFNLLSTMDDKEALDGAGHLNKLNDERKGLAASMVKEAKRKLLNKNKIPEVIVMGNPKWKPGLLGLVANNIAEEYGKPTFFWGRGAGENIKGSCRSNQVTDIFALMNAVPKNFFTHVGGHKFSGGFALSDENVHTLEEELLKAFKKIKDKTSEKEKVFIDSELSLIQRIISNPSFKEALTFLETISFVSPCALLSECPRITYSAPKSFN